MKYNKLGSHIETVKRMPAGKKEQYINSSKKSLILLFDNSRLEGVIISIQSDLQELLDDDEYRNFIKYLQELKPHELSELKKEIVEKNKIN